MTSCLTRRSFLACSTAIALGAPPQRTRMGIASTCYMTFNKVRDTYDFLEHAATIGASGIQAALTSTETGYLKRLRSRAEQLAMYVEVMVGLPQGDETAFEHHLIAAKEAGAVAVRAGALSGRRYETFASLQDWNRFAADSKARVERAVPLLEKHRIPMGLENHKDWTADELVSIMKRHSSEYLGVCLDTGNNIALLEDPMQVVRALAPYTVVTHIKDMAVDDFAAGFLLAEVPLGEGMLDVKAMMTTISQARPKTRMTLEMITRDPLKVPCLTDKYWLTFPDRKRQALAQRLAILNKGRTRLATVTGLSRPAQLALEEENVKRCLRYAASLG